MRSSNCQNVDTVLMQAIGTRVMEFEHSFEVREPPGVLSQARTVTGSSVLGLKE